MLVRSWLNIFSGAAKQSLKIAVCGGKRAGEDSEKSFYNTCSENVLLHSFFMAKHLFIKTVAKLYFAAAKMFLFALVPETCQCYDLQFISFTRNFSFN